MKPSASPKPASGPVFGLTWPTLMVFDWALAGIARSTAGATIVPSPPVTTVRRSRPVFVSFMKSSVSAVARGLQMRHDLGAERGLLFGAPFAEPFARFEPELAVLHKRLQIGRGARPAFDR